MIKNILAIAAFVSLGACATPYVATPYERSAHNVRHVSVVDDALPEKAIAYEVASAGSNFGLIGALVDAGIQASRREAVNDALISINYDAEAMLENRMASELSSKGYNIAPMTAHTREKRELLATYPTTSGTDALLDVSVDYYGYMSAGMGQPFRPSVSAKVRLVKASDNSTIMENIIVYNPLNAQAGTITLTPNPEYDFKNREELLQDPQRLADGITDALNQVATTTIRLLQ